MGEEWRDQLAEAEAGAPVDVPLDPGQARKALSLAMRIGDTLLSAGMSANDVVVLMLRIAETYGLRRAHFDVSYTSISATYYPAPAATPVTAIRVAEIGVVDYTLVQSLDKLCDDIRDGMPVEEALRVYERLSAAPPPYPQWVATAANAGVGAVVTLMFTSSWKILLITFVSGCIMDRALSVLRRWRVPTFYQQLTASGLVTLIAAGVSTAAAHGIPFFAGVDPTLIVVGGVIMLVAGSMFVGAAQDAIDEFYVTASARTYEVVMRTAGIVAGIVIALYLARRMGTPVTISPNPIALGPLAAQYVGATLTSALFALSCYARPVTVALSAAMGLLGWTGYTLAIQAGAGEVAANAVGALAAALIATLLIRRTNVPGFALVSAALLPLVPGLSLYTGLFQTVGAAPGSGDLSEGALTLFLAVKVALGIAAAASFGTYLGRPVAEQFHRIRIRARARRHEIFRR